MIRLVVIGVLAWMAASAARAADRDVGAAIERVESKQPKHREELAARLSEKDSNRSTASIKEESEPVLSPAAKSWREREVPLHRDR